MQPEVYILASRKHGTLYVGVTSNLAERVAQHKRGDVKGFTQKHKVHRLVWAEHHETMEQAIVREKQIKKWNRAWKVQLIEEANPEWDDLYEQLNG
jgi:putative endonuclease